MKRKKSIFYDIFISLPNLPFMVVLAIFLAFKVLKHTGIVEFSMDNVELTSELKKYVKKLYPLHLKVAIALFFWLYVSMELYFRFKN